MSDRVQRHVVLVTGGTGLIGGETILALAKAGARVLAVVRAQSPDHARARLTERLERSNDFHRGLLASIEALPGDTTRPLFGLSPEALAPVNAVVHCAANTEFSHLEDECVWNTNLSGAQHLVDVGHTLAPGARIVFVSTASVTTAPERTTITEDTPYAGHANTYSRSKREAEQLLTASGLDPVIVRPSIVLSRGIHDRVMARSILWAVPIMGELGDVPVDEDAAIDLVPVDYVARALAQLVVKPTVKHRLYHVSAGRSARTFGEVCSAITARHPEIGRIRGIGRHRKVAGRGRGRLMKPLEAYLPFINAGVRYANDRLSEEAGHLVAPDALSYVPDLVGLITLREALSEMYRP